MDKPTPTSSIPRIRTYAKDFEIKQSASTGVSASLPKTEVKEKTSSPRQTENHTYQAPSWTGNKVTPEASHTEQKPEPSKVVPVTAKTVISQTYKAPSLPNHPKEPKKEPVVKVIDEPKEKEESVLKPINTPKVNQDSNIEVIDTEGANSAVIISDTKKNRFRLFPSIFASVKNWFKEKREKREARKIPKYTVPEASLRQGVIQKATSQTGKLTDFDHTSIQARIRERQGRAIPKAPVTIWTANTEPGYPLLEAPEVVSKVEVVPRKSVLTKLPVAEIITPPPTPPLPVVPDVPVVPVVPVVPAKVEVPEVVIKVEPTVTPVTQSVPVSPSVPEVVVTPPQPVEVPLLVEVKEPIKEERPTEITTKLKPGSFREWLFIINTNSIAIGVAGLVLSVALVGLAGYYWYGSDTNSLQIALSPSHPTVIDSPLQLITLPEASKSSLFENVVKNYRESSYNVLQLIFVDSADKNLAIPAPIILQLLGSDLSSAFTQSISHVYFGGVEKTQPFMLLATTDANTAKGGMLAWEKTILGDLSPLFITNNLATSTLANYEFTDLVIDNNDIRIVEDESGKIILLYGLVKGKSLLITNQIATYQELTKLIK